MAGRRTRFFGWCEPSAYCRKHDGTQLTGSLHCRRFKSVGQLGARVGRGRVDQVNGGADSEPSEVAWRDLNPRLWVMSHTTYVSAASLCLWSPR